LNQPSISQKPLVLLDEERVNQIKIFRKSIYDKKMKFFDAIISKLYATGKRCFDFRNIDLRKRKFILKIQKVIVLLCESMSV